MRRVLEEYEASGLRRREFCQQRGIALTTFDYWRREHAVKRGNKSGGRAWWRSRWLPANLRGSSRWRLANGRRIECSWRFADAELARLIRIAESA